MEFEPAFSRRDILRVDFSDGGPGANKKSAAANEEFRFGIEEEYFLSDAQTLEIAAEIPECLFDNARAETGGRIAREFLQPQVEVGTLPHVAAAVVRSDLLWLRQTVAAAAGQHGFKILASGTHPTARWRKVEQTPGERYNAVMNGLQMIGQRNMLCGMHVHVEFPDPDRRVDVMARMLPYIPLFLALSTSSPFWQSHCTGLKGYRLAAYDELPRTGLPELFRTAEEYESYVAALINSGVMEDSSYIWWSIRPSHKYPTLELRAPDCCTRVNDALAIAALYRAMVRHLFVHPGHNANLDVVDRAIAVENKWRAQRYGVQGTLVTREGAITFGEMLERVLEDIAPDAAVLGCEAELADCRKIMAAGTSADAQLAIFHDRAQGRGEESALQAVARWIADETVTC
jgi:carboxylate-amine ligase